jgi:hypothetical protein
MTLARQTAYVNKASELFAKIPSPDKTPGFYAADNCPLDEHIDLMKELKFALELLQRVPGLNKHLVLPNSKEEHDVAVPSVQDKLSSPCSPELAAKVVNSVAKNRTIAFSLAKDCRDIFPAECFKAVQLDHTWFKDFLLGFAEKQHKPETINEQKRLLDYVNKYEARGNEIFNYCGKLVDPHGPAYKFWANFLDRAKYAGNKTWKEEIESQLMPGTIKSAPIYKKLETLFIRIDESLLYKLKDREHYRLFKLFYDKEGNIYKKEFSATNEKLQFLSEFVIAMSYNGYPTMASDGLSAVTSGKPPVDGENELFVHQKITSDIEQLYADMDLRICTASGHVQKCTPFGSLDISPRGRIS